MEIRDLKATDVELKKIHPWWRFWDKLWMLSEDAEISFQTPEYYFKLQLKKGFKTDGRSGPIFINPFAPKWADHWYNWAILLHDAGYNDIEGLELDFNELQFIFEAILEKSTYRDRADIMAMCTQKFSFTDWTNISQFDEANQPFITYAKINWSNFGEM